jgi:hypothetical protein
MPTDGAWSSRTAGRGGRWTHGRNTDRSGGGPTAAGSALQTDAETVAVAHMSYDREEHLLGLSDAAFARDPELLVTRLRTLAAASGAGMTVDDRVEVIERMSMFMDTRASQLAAAGRVSGVLSGELKTWAVPAAEHRRLCGRAVQMLAVVISANAVCAVRIDEARAVGTEAAAALAAIVNAATSGSKLPPPMAVALGNVLLLLASDSPRQSVWDSMSRSERPPQCVWVGPAFAATLGACDGKTCTKDVSNLNDRSREAEMALGSARTQWLWPLIASCPYPMGLLSAGYVAMEGAAHLLQVVVALIAVFGCIVVLGLSFEWKTEASAWKDARELQLQWLSLLNEACTNLPLVDDELETTTESKPEPEPEPEPALRLESVGSTETRGVEVDMGKELEKLQRAFESSGAADDHDLGPGSASGADTSETSGLAVPLPDDLEPNLKLLLSALEKEGDTDTVEMRNRLQEQLEWLSSQKEQAAAATTT